MNLETAMELRRSVRAFRSDPVAPDVLRRIFTRAQSAPSWCNIQPWRVWVASGKATQRLGAKLVETAQTQGPEPDVGFPGEYPEPYGARRKECGKALYAAMGVARDDFAGRQGAWLRNFVAFDAPHVAIVGIDRRFGIYAALDVGCWLEALLLAATAEGVSSCAQASLAAYPNAVRSELEMPDDVAILFGVGLGYEDTSADANKCRTTREPIDSHIVFRDD